MASATWAELFPELELSLHRHRYLTVIAAQLTLRAHTTNNLCGMYVSRYAGYGRGYEDDYRAEISVLDDRPPEYFVVEASLHPPTTVVVLSVSLFSA